MLTRIQSSGPATKMSMLGLDALDAQKEFTGTGFLPTQKAPISAHL